MNTDTMLTFLEAMLLAQEGKDPSQAIENQERRGQQNVVRNSRLPKKTNEHTVPRETSWQGVTNSMSYEERREIINKNIYNYTRAQYEKMGIQIVEDYDDLFWTVVLPEGWETRATDHTMWNELVDNKGRKRGTFFYKAAFYDRDSFMNFETRFQPEVTRDCAPDEDYEIWRKADFIGVVKDGENIIYKTTPVPVTDDYDRETKIRNALYDEAEAFLIKDYPNYKDIHAYWED